MANDSITPAASVSNIQMTSTAPMRQIHNTAEAAPATGTRATEPAGKPPGMDDVRDAVRKIEDAIVPSAQDLRFTIDEDTGTPIIKLIDTTTNTVLRQIPTVEALEISKALDKLQGLLVRETA